MADVQKDTILLQVQTNFGEAIEEIAQLQERIDNLKAANKEWMDENKKLADSNKELATSNKMLTNAMKMDDSLRAENTRKINENNKLIQENSKKIQENRGVIAQNETVIRNLTSRQREYKKEVDDQIKSHQENEGSIKQMRLELIQMRKEYESLSKADRESDKGKDMLKNIADTTEELKGLEQAQGDWRREVGHYQNALQNLDPILGKTLSAFLSLSKGTGNIGVAFTNAIPKIKSFGTALKALATNPFVLAITAIILLIKQLIDQFKKNDEAMTSLQQLFAAFEPILEVFRELLNTIVIALTKVIGTVTKAVTAIMSIIPSFGAASEAAQQYVKDLDALEEAERQYTVETAKNNVEIARLRNKVAQADKYSVEERKRFLEQAIALEKRNLDMELQVAKEKLRLAKEDAARRRDTSDDTKNNIAQLEAAYFQAIANSEAGMRRLYSQLSQFNKQIRKETDDTLKAIMANSRLSASERRDALQQRKENLQKLGEDVKAFEQRYKNAALGLIDVDWHEAKKDLDNAKETYKEMQNDIKNDEESMNDDLLSKFLSRLNTQKQAIRAYEDAVLEMMDESLEKQLDLIEKQYDREIEDIKQRLKYEKNLTVEARKALQDLIDIKEKQRAKTRILTEAKYWSEVREMAKNTIDEIAKYERKVTLSDPNRVMGGFMAEIMNAMTEVQTDFAKESQILSDKYLEFFTPMVEVMKRKLAEVGVDMSENTKKAMQALIADKDNLKSLDSFLLAWENIRVELEMTNDEVDEFTKLVYPYLTNINNLYTTLAQIPQRYTEYMSNLIVNKTKESAAKIRNTVMDAFDFSGVGDEVEAKIDQIIKETDNALKKAPNSWQYRVENGIAMPYEDYKFNVDVNVEFADPQSEEVFEELEGDSTVYLKWDINIDENSDTGKKFQELGEKYGAEFDKSFSGVLKYISGSENIDEQLDYLVRHYDEAVRKVEDINKDMYYAFQQTNDNDFYFARIDESVILPQLRRLYELTTNNGKAVVDFERERLEIEGQYVGDADRDLKIQYDLLSLENRRLEMQKRTDESKIEYLNRIRGEVARLENDYQRINTEESANISNLNEQLVVLANERQNFNADTDQALVERNRQQTEEIEKKIAEARERIKNSLDALAAMGFMSVDEVDAAMAQLTNSVISANNTIVENTAKQSQTAAQLWLNSFNNVVGGIQSVTQAFNSMFTEMGEMNDEMNSFAEATAYFLIGLNLATGIASAVAKGMELGWPAAAVMIPLGISLVVASIGEALSVYSQYHKPNYADGGLIGGRYAKTRAEGRRDDIDIRASKGEYIINAESVKKYGVDFLDMINYGKQIKAVFPKFRYADGGYVTDSAIQSANNQMSLETMNEMMLNAMSEIQPVVSVAEISNVQNKVRVKEHIARK